MTNRSNCTSVSHADALRRLKENGFKVSWDTEKRLWALIEHCYSACTGRNMHAAHDLFPTTYWISNFPGISGDSWDLPWQFSRLPLPRPNGHRPPDDIPHQSPAVEAAATAAAAAFLCRSYCPPPPMMTLLTTNLTCCASSCWASPHLAVPNRPRCFHVNVVCHSSIYVPHHTPSSSCRHALFCSCVWHVFRYPKNIRIKLNIILMHLSVVDWAWWMVVAQLQHRSVQ